MRWIKSLRSFCALTAFSCSCFIAIDADGQVAPDNEQLGRGKHLFIKEWKARDPANPNGDGLGPLFNANSCVACHRQGGVGGGGPNQVNAQLLTAVAPKDDLNAADRARFRHLLMGVHPAFNLSQSTIVFHRFGTDADYAPFRQDVMGLIVPEGLTEVRRARMLRAVQSRLDKAGPIKPLHFHGVDLLLSERNTPALFGAAQIDALDMNELHQEAVRQKKRAQGITGRVPPGKFGWRGQTMTLRDFILGACAVELGLQLEGHAQFTDPNYPKYKPPGDDMDAHQMTDLVAYTSHLPAPLQRIPFQQTTEIRYGENLFKTIGCGDCHVKSLGDMDGLYSDLLLHDMGPELTDPSPAAPEQILVGTRSVGGGGGGGYFGSVDVDVFATVPSEIKQEWRTPPLWGVAISAPYLHDGRAATLDEAIGFHGGEASRSRRAYGKLRPGDRAALMAFLTSLVGPTTADDAPEEKPAQ